MNLGYVKVATCTPKIKVGDVEHNVKSIISGIDKAKEAGVQLLVLPELCLTGSTAGDLFLSKTLLDGAKSGLKAVAEYTKGLNMIVFLGMPIEKDGCIYNACAGVSDGTVLAIVPKSTLSNDENSNQGRYFSAPSDELSYVTLGGLNGQTDMIPFGKNILFADENKENFKVGVEIGNDIECIVPPSAYHTANGARIIVNLSADNEFSGNPIKRKKTVESLSERTVSAYVLANAGEGESTTDSVFSGHSVISEIGETLAESLPFDNRLSVCEIDLDEIDYHRTKTTLQKDFLKREYCFVGFSVITGNAIPERSYDKTPFIREGEEEFLLDIQAQALAKRLEHTSAGKAVLGLSGGLDSTLALIVCVRAMKILGRPLKDVLTVTMPCFGTSSRTLDNSIKLAKSFGVTLKKVDITKTVRRHLKDIGHLETVHDAAYENAQARERTQVLMDVANMCNGLVVGTGDLSELALGWATYNGDHMSMYAVNGSVPKTLVRHLVGYTASKSKGKIKATLLDILDTPVSPELIPSNDNTIKQVTEDIVGPYVLHDYFLYSMLKRGFTPAKIYYSACNTFKDDFDNATVLKWLKIFVRRFFNQQFKRSCLPDGVKVTEISLSPRGGFVMPSDAVSKLWLEELENLY